MFLNLEPYIIQDSKEAVNLLYLCQASGAHAKFLLAKDVDQEK
jgi:hypothetical protein